MTTVLAVPLLVDAVAAVFAADAAAQDPPVEPVAAVFGWREVARAPVALPSGTWRRIAWVPGDDSTGALGRVGAASTRAAAGGGPRSLATLFELVTVYLEAADTSAPENERAQYTAARLLFDAWLRAVHLSAFGTYTIDAAEWLTEKTERRYGAGLRIVLAVEAAVPDAPFETAPADARAVIAVSELDVTESMESAPPAP